ncbi:MAG: SEC-C domain-containing protein [Fluviicola sp.]|nr:SEC-C domain-containing protein [Fluviicola sp.]
MKLGRNDRCFCGSGKKYKKCCLGKATPPELSPSEIFFRRYNTIDLLKSFAGLSLLPENHGKNFRLEELAFLVSKNSNSNTELANQKELKNFLDEEHSYHLMEDYPTNLFTDLVTFYGGDYLIFPGITEYGSFPLSSLFKAIFHWPTDSIPDDFRNNCIHLSLFILSLSDQIAQRLDTKRYTKGIIEETEIYIPSKDIFDKLKSAVSFSKTEIIDLLKRNQIAPEAMAPFIFDSDLESNPNESVNPIWYKPIIRIEDEFIVVSPTTMSLALTDFIWSEAERRGCIKEVNDAYHNFIWNQLQGQLGIIGFDNLDFVISSEQELNSKIGLYRFDSDKIALVQYIYDSGENYKTAGFTLDLKGLSIQAKSVFTNLKENLEFKDYEFFHLIVISPIGREFMIPLRGDEQIPCIALTPFEIDVLWNSGDTKAIDLWKFAVARSKTLSSNGGLSYSLLDQFKFYKEHHESFYWNDNTKSAWIDIEPGYAAELIYESKLKKDAHSVPKKVNGRVVNVEVLRKDEYEPVYVDLSSLASGELEFMMEGFSQAVWVRPKNTVKGKNDRLRHIYWEINCLISYWLWQIQDDIKGDLKFLGESPIEILFDLILERDFDANDMGIERVDNLLDFFQYKVLSDGIIISVPKELMPYLYGTDNAGERVLVQVLLLALNELFNSKSSPLIDTVRIAQIIEQKAPLGHKKKMLMLDPNDNILILPDNLSDHRLVQEYDCSIVLDTICPKLGTDCPPVGKITNIDDKRKLSSEIVQKALLPLLREKINLFNGEDLLKELISLNESLIKRKEELRIFTPTRIACYVSVEQHQIDLSSEMGLLDRTSIATRCLIEHIAAEGCTGNKIVSTAGLDELIAIMDQINIWGSLSDQINFNLVDIDLGILASGRVGTSKGHKDVFEAYYTGKTNENIEDAVDHYSQVFPQIEGIEGEDIPIALDDAFKADFGVTLTRICEFIDTIALIGHFQKAAWASFELKLLRDKINEYASFDESEFQNAISYLSLTNRGKVENIPTGYDYLDIFPWRFNRMLSLLRKPIVIVKNPDSESEIVYWGVRQSVLCKRFISEQLFSDRFRALKDSKVKKYLGTFAQKRGAELVQTILATIKEPELIIDTDVYIGPKHSLKNEKDIGDIDILIIDASRRLLFSIECKSMSPSRNIKEMVEELNKIFGGEKGWLKKHEIRHDWIKNNREQITKKYQIDVSDFEIRSFFVTQEEMLTPHIKEELSMPFLTSYDITKDGYNTLVR